MGKREEINTVWKRDLHRSAVVLFTEDGGKSRYLCCHNLLGLQSETFWENSTALKWTSSFVDEKASDLYKGTSWEIQLPWNDIWNSVDEKPLVTMVSWIQLPASGEYTIIRDVTKVSFGHFHGPEFNGRSPLPESWNSNQFPISPPS